MLKKMLKLVILFITLILVLPKSVEAKVLPQSAKQGTKVVRTGSTISVSAKMRPDRRALNVFFSNLQNAKSVSYMLTYRTSEQEEAAMGALNLAGQSSDKAELLFGTCSKNVCRYHTGVKNARLEVSYTLNSGKKYLKKFRVRV